uniref:Cold-shock protein n=1 Tax=Caenorhabditis tropicalis TaxID=1561998 RepID=A0A1I7U7T6_9PELO
MPKNTKKSQGKKKMELTNKQFDDLLKEVGGLPPGMALDENLLAALREATNNQFNKVATEKYGEIPEGSDDDEDEEMNEQPKEATSDKKTEETSSNKA